MAKYEISLPNLHPKQQLIYDDPHLYKVVCCGRRFGKTKLAKRIILEKALMGEATAIFLPTYAMSTTLWRSINADLATFRNHKNFWRSEQERILILPTGGSISFYSSDKSGDKVRGNKYDYVVIDEAAMITDLEELWNASLGPTLTDSDGGALFISTPRSAGDYFHRLFKMHEKYEEYASFTFTTYDNPYIKKKVIDRYKETRPERVFQQEYLAHFLDDVGEVFKNVSAVATGNVLEPYEGRFVMASDFGRVNDWTVVVVFDADSRQMVDYMRMTGLGFKLQMQRINQFYQKWRPYVFVAEANSYGMSNIEMLRDDYNIPVQAFYTLNTNKQLIMDQLATDIENQNIVLLSNRELISELQSYQMDVLPSGNYRFGAPKGMHDDFVMATAIANYSVSKVTGTFGVAMPQLPGWSKG